jgi:hypothetical protein
MVMRRSALETWRARRRDRGAALFIVVLVIASLTSVALFAARSTSTDVEIASRYKQANQTKGVAKMGIQVSLSELSRDPTTYVRAMKDTNVFLGSTPLACRFEVKKNIAGLDIDTGGCFRFAYGGVEAAIQQASTPATTELLPAGQPSTQKPSSLGLAEVRPNFGVEMTDKAVLDWPAPGFQAGASSNMKFYAVTMTGIGQILPRDPGAPANQWGTLDVAGKAWASANAYKASVEEIRAQVVVGPLPAGL